MWLDDVIVVSLATAVNEYQTLFYWSLLPSYSAIEWLTLAKVLGRVRIVNVDDLVKAFRFTQIQSHSRYCRVTIVFFTFQACHRRCRRLAKVSPGSQSSGSQGHQLHLHPGPHPGTRKLNESSKKSVSSSFQLTKLKRKKRHLKIKTLFWSMSKKSLLCFRPNCRTFCGFRYGIIFSRFKLKSFVVIIF